MATTIFLLAEKVITKLDAISSKGRDPRSKLPSLLDQAKAENPNDEQNKHHFGSSYPFNCLVGALILVNSLLVGIEMDRNVGGGLQGRLLFFVSDCLFGAAFFAELCVRTHQVGWNYFLDHWNILDFALVVINIADLISAVDNANGVQLASALRVLRLLRIARHIQDIRMLNGMWMVVQGLLGSLRSLVWTAGFLLIIIYCFAVALVTLTGQDETLEAEWQDKDFYIGSVFRSALTVCQVFTLDNWASAVVRPLIGSGNISGPIIFLTAIIVCNFGVLNIIIALMVERMSTMTTETERRKGKILKQVEEKIIESLLKDFVDSDEDSNGMLEKIEFQNLLDKKSVKDKLQLLGIRANEANDIFDILDISGDGYVDVQEFVEGLSRIRGMAKSVDLLYLICFTKRQCCRAKECVKRVRAMSAKVDVIQQRLNVRGRELSLEVRERQHFHLRKDNITELAENWQGYISSADTQRMLEFPALGREPDDYFLN